jgi:hypothetical protein
MQDEPQGYNICECCGTEFGNDDDEYSHDELRAQWIARGAQWFFRTPPVGWNPWLQLAMAGVEMTYSASVFLADKTSLVSVEGTSVGVFAKAA